MCCSSLKPRRWSPISAVTRPKVLLAIEGLAVLGFAYVSVVLWIIAAGAPIEVQSGSDRNDLLIALAASALTAGLVVAFVMTWRRSHRPGAADASSTTTP